MSPIEWIEFAAGVAVVGLILYDIFSSVIVPRQVSPQFRLSGYMVRWSWRAWRAIGLRTTDPDKREDWLARYAPFFFVVLLAVWILMLNFGYGLILYALRDQTQPPLTSLLEAMYFAGTSLLTVGYGDIVAIEPLARTIALIAAFTGLSTFAIIVSFIFSLFGSFQRREVFIVMMGSRSGAPASGVTLLETMAKYNMPADIAADFRSGEDWAAAVLESHLAYPILAYFRSSHDDESWIGTLGALLDAATMIITLTDSPIIGRAKLFHHIGVHLVRDLSRYFGVEQTESVGIERAEFEQACAQLTAAGLHVRCDGAAWAKFSEFRKQYAGPLNAMARFWVIPPTRWIGDRSQIRRH